MHKCVCVNVYDYVCVRLLLFCLRECVSLALTLCANYSFDIKLFTVESGANNNALSKVRGFIFKLMYRGNKTSEFVTGTVFSLHTLSVHHLLFFYFFFRKSKKEKEFPQMFDIWLSHSPVPTPLWDAGPSTYLALFAARISDRFGRLFQNCFKFYYEMGYLLTVILNFSVKYS